MRVPINYNTHSLWRHTYVSISLFIYLSIHTCNSYMCVCVCVCILYAHGGLKASDIADDRESVAFSLSVRRRMHMRRRIHV